MENQIRMNVSIKTFNENEKWQLLLDNLKKLDYLREWNGPGTRRLKESKFSDSDTILYG